MGDNPLMLAYHDEEWGVPLHDDLLHFEHLVLDGFQAGLSWAIVLKKREAFRQALDGFDPGKIARYTKRTVDGLMKNPEIIRSRQKIEATISNAKVFLRVQEELGSFDEFIWQLAGGKTRQNRWRTLKQLPAHTKQSEQMSKALKERGFKFVGPTICYAYMQAAGMVNDHVVKCFRYRELGGKA
jgi:DNA-3-methyladenine glycosylase I